MPSTTFIVFVHPGASREPLGFYEGRGQSRGQQKNDAIRQCRADLGIHDGFMLSAVDVVQCCSRETARAGEAHSRRATK